MMLTVPLYDDSPRVQVPIATGGIIAACGVVFLWQVGQGPRAAEAIALAYGLVPAVFFGTAELPTQLQLVPAWATLFTSMFLHGGWLHLLGNMLYLWIFGRAVETALGPLRFIVFYFLCGAVAGLVQAAIDPAAEVPMVGASGAIAGVLGAYLVLYPRGNVVVLFWFFIFIRLITVPAVIMLGLWFLLQLFSATSARVGGGGVAFWAHVGGFIAGIVLVWFFRRGGVAVFQAPQTSSFRLAHPRDARGDWRRSFSDEGRGTRRRGPWG
jgi:membrane associated rhomboid family serine protease